MAIIGTTFAFDFDRIGEIFQNRTYILYLDLQTFLIEFDLLILKGTGQLAPVSNKIPSQGYIRISTLSDPLPEILASDETPKLDR